MCKYSHKENGYLEINHHFPFMINIWPSFPNKPSSPKQPSIRSSMAIFRFLSSIQSGSGGTKPQWWGTDEGGRSGATTPGGGPNGARWHQQKWIKVDAKSWYKHGYKAVQLCHNASQGYIWIYLMHFQCIFNDDRCSMYVQRMFNICLMQTPWPSMTIHQAHLAEAFADAICEGPAQLTSLGTLEDRFRSLDFAENVHDHI